MATEPAVTGWRCGEPQRPSTSPPAETTRVGTAYLKRGGLFIGRVCALAVTYFLRYAINPSGERYRGRCP